MHACTHTCTRTHTHTHTLPPNSFDLANILTKAIPWTGLWKQVFQLQVPPFPFSISPREMLSKRSGEMTCITVPKTMNDP